MKREERKKKFRTSLFFLYHFFQPHRPSPQLAPRTPPQLVSSFLFRGKEGIWALRRRAIAEGVEFEEETKTKRNRIFFFCFHVIHSIIFLRKQLLESKQKKNSARALKKNCQGRGEESKQENRHGKCRTKSVRRKQDQKNKKKLPSSLSPPC